CPVPTPRNNRTIKTQLLSRRIGAGQQSSTSACLASHNRELPANKQSAINLQRKAVHVTVGLRIEGQVEGTVGLQSAQVAHELRSEPEKASGDDDWAVGLTSQYVDLIRRCGHEAEVERAVRLEASKSPHACARDAGENTAHQNSA